MSKGIKIVILFIALVLIFNKKIVSYFILYGISEWTNRTIVLDKIQINNSQSLITIHDLKVKNSKGFDYDNIFESKKISLNYNPKSLFSNLIIINNLIIENSNFFLELIEQSPTSYNDNIGIAKKNIENMPDKIWPEKKRDINFLILKTRLSGTKTFIKTSSVSDATEIKLSNMYFNKVGNEKNYQHYKDVLKLILFDIIARTSNLELKNLLKKIYDY